MHFLKKEVNINNLIHYPIHRNPALLMVSLHPAIWYAGQENGSPFLVFVVMGTVGSDSLCSLDIIPLTLSFRQRLLRVLFPSVSQGNGAEDGTRSSPPDSGQLRWVMFAGL